MNNIKLRKDSDKQSKKLNGVPLKQMSKMSTESKWVEAFCVASTQNMEYESILTYVLD